MWESIIEALQKLGDVNTFTVIVVIGLVAIANWLIKLLTDSTGFAILFTPAMIFGSLAANYLFVEYYVTPTQDKNSNIVIASALGVLAAMGFMLLATRGVVAISDRRRKKISLRLAGTVGLDTSRSEGR
jgi:uncharacterized membrane protein